MDWSENTDSQNHMFYRHFPHEKQSYLPSTGFTSKSPGVAGRSSPHSERKINSHPFWGKLRIVSGWSYILSYRFNPLPATLVPTVNSLYWGSDFFWEFFLFCFGNFFCFLSFLLFSFIFLSFLSFLYCFPSFSTVFLHFHSVFCVLHWFSFLFIVFFIFHCFPSFSFRFLRFTLVALHFPFFSFASLRFYCRSALIYARI